MKVILVALSLLFINLLAAEVFPIHSIQLKGYSPSRQLSTEEQSNNLLSPLLGEQGEPFDADDPFIRRLYNAFQSKNEEQLVSLFHPTDHPDEVPAKMRVEGLFHELGTMVLVKSIGYIKRPDLVETLSKTANTHVSGIVAIRFSDAKKPTEGKGHPELTSIGLPYSEIQNRRWLSGFIPSERESTE